MLALSTLPRERAGCGTGAGGGALARLADAIGGAAFPPAGVPAEDLLQEVERGLFARATEAAGGNQTRAAELLRMTRDRLRYRMKIFGVVAPDAAGRRREAA